MNCLPMFIVLFQDLTNTNLNTIPKSHMVFSACVSVYGMHVCVKYMCVLYILLCVVYRFLKLVQRPEEVTGYPPLPLSSLFLRS